jgi:hypothetical protein
MLHVEEMSFLPDTLTWPLRPRRNQLSVDQVVYKERWLSFTRIYMAWGFEEGRVYNRRAGIHTKYGGQQQGGIITPARHPLIIIITGEEGLLHGYADRTLCRRHLRIFRRRSDRRYDSPTGQFGNCLNIPPRVKDCSSSEKRKKECGIWARWSMRSTISRWRRIEKAINVLQSSLN